MWGLGEPGTPVSALDAEMPGLGRGWALDVLVCVWDKAATQHARSLSCPPGVKSRDAKASGAVSWSGISEQKCGPATRSKGWGQRSSKDSSCPQYRLAPPQDRSEPRGAGWGISIQQSRGTRPCQLPPGPWPGKVPRGHAESLPESCLLRCCTGEAVAPVSSRHSAGAQA